MNINKKDLSRSDLLQIININKIINSELKLSKVLNIIVELACKTMNSSLSSVMLFNEDKTFLRVVSSIGIKPEIMPKIKVEIGYGVSGWVAEHGKSLLIKDITTDKRIKTGNKKYKKDKYFTPSCLSVPLFHNNILIGVFNINNKNNNEIYTDRDKKFLEYLAEQVAIAIKNAELYNVILEHKKELEEMNDDLEESAFALSEYTEELYTLHEITKMIAQRISSYSEWNILIKEILDLFFSIESLYVHEVMLLTIKNNNWNIESIRQIESDYTGIKSVDKELLKNNFKNKLIELSSIAMDSNEIILIPEYENKFKEFYNILKQYCSSMILVPLKNKKEPIGILILIRNDKLSYSEKDRNLMNVIGLQIAAALSLGRAYDEEVKGKVFERELELAYNIQNKLLPTKFPNINGVDIFGNNIPAKSVGGDYYDVLVHNDGKIGFVVADVSGKGIPAALIMTMLRSYLHSEIKRGADSCVEILNVVNELILRDIEGDRYVTMFYGILDIEEMTFEYAKAGHNPPIIVHKDGTFDILDGRGLFVGMFEDGLYEKNSVKLKNGDKVVLYTDGITEAMNLDFKEFGVDRLKKILKANRDKHVVKISEEIYKEIDKFSDNAPQHDDMTVLIFGFNSEKSDIKLTYNSNVKEIKKFLKIVEDKMNEYGIKDSSLKFTVRLVADELLCNSMEHGNKFDDTKKVNIEFSITKEYIKFIFEDEGNGFNWKNRMMLTKKKDSEKVLSDRGRGIKVCNRAVDVLEYNEKGNKVTAILYLDKNKTYK